MKLRSYNAHLICRFYKTPTIKYDTQTNGRTDGQADRKADKETNRKHTPN